MIQYKEHFMKDESKITKYYKKEINEIKIEIARLKTLLKEKEDRLTELTIQLRSIRSEK